MACRHSISTRVTLLTQRFHPSFSYILQDDDCKREAPDPDPSRRPIKNFLQLGSYNSSINCATAGVGALFRERRCSSFSLQEGLGFSFCRYASSTIGEGSDKIEHISDVAEVFTEKTVEAVASQVPAVSEVAIAAADSFFPVAALQYLIDNVHNFTGLNWWASIALTTLLIRGTTLPLLIQQLKATSKLTLMRPRLNEIKQQMQDMDIDPKVMNECQKRMQELFKEYGVTPLAPLKGLFIRGSIFFSFFFALTNMVEKVPSFKAGGAFWFTDLTTPDSLYIFPVLMSLTFIATETYMKVVLKLNHEAGSRRNISMIFFVLAVPLTMNFPKALFCHWITSNLFSLICELVLRRPAVKKFLGIPEIPMAPTTALQPPFSLYSAFRQFTAETSKPSVPMEPAKPSDQRLSLSSVLSQRLRSLLKRGKGIKNDKS